MTPVQQKETVARCLWVPNARGGYSVCKGKDGKTGSEEAVWVWDWDADVGGGGGNVCRMRTAKDTVKKD